MRTTTLTSLMILSILAACGDSSSDGGKKDDDSKVDAGGSNDNSNDTGDELSDIDDEELDDCDKGDPCCINSDQFDFVTCHSVDPEAGVAAADAGTAAAN